MTEYEFLNRVEEMCFEPVRIDRGNNWILLHTADGLIVEYVYGSDVVRIKTKNFHFRWKSKFLKGEDTDGLACDLRLEWNRDYMLVSEWSVLQKILNLSHVATSLTRV